MDTLSEKMNLIQVLPGLYLIRDQINEQIATIERSLGWNIEPKQKYRGRVLGSKNKPKVIPVPVAEIKSDGIPPLISVRPNKPGEHLSVFQRMTPEQRERKRALDRANKQKRRDKASAEKIAMKEKQSKIAASRWNSLSVAQKKAKIDALNAGKLAKSKAAAL